MLDGLSEGYLQQETSGKSEYEGDKLFLPYSEFWVEGMFEDSGTLPPFWGPTLRGGLGYHLKKTVCHVKHRICSECIVRRTCAYSYIFEGVPPEDRDIMRLYPNIPQPFVLTADMNCPTQIETGQTLRFGMRLFGKAIDLFPYIVYSFLEIGKHGLGKDRIPFCINTIIQSSDSAILYQDGQNRLGILKKEYTPPAVCGQGNRLVLSFLTPAKIQIEGKEAKTADFEMLIRAACRRLQILSYFYGNTRRKDNLPLADYSFLSKVQKIQDSTSIYQFSRFSGRQQKEVPLKGIIGSVVFEGPWKDYISILRWAQICHIGKATSFGFGRINISQE